MPRHVYVWKRVWVWLATLVVCSSRQLLQPGYGTCTWQLRPSQAASHQRLLRHSSFSDCGRLSTFEHDEAAVDGRYCVQDMTYFYR